MVDRSHLSVDQLQKIESGVVGGSYTRKPAGGYSPEAYTDVRGPIGQ